MLMDPKFTSIHTGHGVRTGRGVELAGATEVALGEEETWLV
jgi:hypothetical protein